MAKGFAKPLEGSFAFRSNCDQQEWEAFDPSSPVWSLTDAGPVWGAVLVERFRTLGGRLLHLNEHRERLQLGAEFCGWPANELVRSFDSLVNTLLDANRELIEQSGDASVICLFSPHDSGWQSHGYLLPIPFERLDRWYREGAALCSVDISPPVCSGLPSAIKHRSRFAYWAADQRAEKQIRGANALLCTENGNIADTSLANIALWNREAGWRTPLDCDCHPGSTLAKTQRLLFKAGEAIVKASLSLRDLMTADAAVLLGSTGLTWPIATLNGANIGTELGMCKVLELRKRWIDFAEIDFVSQAAFWAERTPKSSL